MKKKICFIIMGFGKKSDPLTGRTLDLDKTYENIISPAVTAAGLECVRADEIQDSGLIDKSMYALLMHADLVIADISTYNPNAIYELGIRHAVRPYSTIIIKEQQGKIPFDLDHNRIFHYDHMGDDISATEAERCKKELQDRIVSVLESSSTDSPLYEYIKGIKPPLLPESEYEGLIEKLAKEEKYIFAMRHKALAFMKQKDFSAAERTWRKLSEIIENEPYFIQQQALCRYKSEDPSPTLALQDALTIITKLDPDGDTTDPETLGITGAIYKNLYRQHKDVDYLNRAICYYQKCYIVRRDYYTGENYAHCLELKANESASENEKIYLRFEAEKTRQAIIDQLLTILSDSGEKRIDQKWLYATLSNCYLAIGNHEGAKTYEDKFLSDNPLDWEIETFNKSKTEL
jgi:hypothetical protein